MPSPPWTEPVQKMQMDLAVNRAGWQSLENYEVSQSPLYYALTGAEWRAGQELHADGGHLLYWVRFFNIAVVVVLVVLGYIAACIALPENRFARVGVPAFLAFIPQTAFYSISNDMLPSICFGVTFICLLKWLSKDTPSIPLGIASGLGFAATYLSKTTTIPLLAVAVAVILIRTGLLLRHEKWRPAVLSLIAFAGSAVPLILVWMFWCKVHFGDLMGSKLKMEHFGWTVMPLNQWWHHPIFTLNGLWTFWSGNMNTLWQGEFKWHKQPLFLPGTDIIYSLLSSLLLLTALPALIPRFSRVTAAQRRALLLCVVCFLAELGFLALFSIAYDYHDCPYPSRWHPFWTSGRLLLGTLIPISLLMVYGLDRLLGRFGSAVKFSTLAAMMLGILIVEITTDWRIFSNPFNWYHLP